jgi:hypothetical protein
LTDVSEVPTASIALMMEAVETSETAINFYQTTRRSIPENNHLQDDIFLFFIYSLFYNVAVSQTIQP